jgi:hypothetical protein
MYFNQRLAERVPAAQGQTPRIDQAKLGVKIKSRANWTKCKRGHEAEY